MSTQQEQLRNKRHLIYRQCTRDEIALPLKDGSKPLPKGTLFLSVVLL